MKKIAITISLIILMFCSTMCKNKNIEINRITYKWNAQKSIGKNCEDCEVNSKECCEIEYLGVKYVKNASFEINALGEIEKVYTYHVPLGVNILTIDDYISTFQKDQSLRNQKIIWDKSKREIIDNGKSISEFEIDTKLKKIYILNNQRITIYEYN
jgi:hypothetical protein